MNLPLVSIVIPTFNRISYLEIAINSVLKQSYKNIQLIIVDDASTDNTVNILRDKYTTQLKLVVNKVNLGQSKSLNKGWSKCTGKYFSYLSSDDYLYPDAISSLVKILERNNAIICVYPNNDLVDSLGKRMKHNICNKFNFMHTLSTLECPIGVGALFRSSVYKKTNGWNYKNTLMPDIEFWLAISKYGEFYFLKKILAAYRFHKDSGVYKNYSSNELNEVLVMINKQFLINKTILAKKDKILSNAYVFLARYNLRNFNFKNAVFHIRKAQDLNQENVNAINFLKLLRNAYSPLIRILLKF